MFPTFEVGLMAPSELAILLIAVMFAIFSISYIFFGWNIFFTTSEHIYLAGNTAIVLSTVLLSLNSTAILPITKGRYLLIIPVLIGLLTFSRMTRYRWLSRYPVAVLSGIGLGLLVGGTIRPEIIGAADLTITNLMAAITRGTSGIAGSLVSGSYSSPLGGLSWGQEWEILSATIMLIGTLVVLIYFTYSVQYSHTFHEGKLAWLAKLGKYVLLLALGQQWVASATSMGTRMMIFWLRRPLVEILAYFGISI